MEVPHQRPKLWLTSLGQPEGATLAQVYSLDKGYWGSLHSKLPQCLRPLSVQQVCVSGALHWLVVRWMSVNTSYFVLTFDVASESFGGMGLPMSIKVDKMMKRRLSVSGDGNIALFVTSRSENADEFLDIWLMQDYGVEKSWTKVIVLGPQGPKRRVPEALCFRRNGEVLLVLKDNTHELVSLDIVSKQLRNLGNSGGQDCSVACFEESLVLLDKKDAVSY